MLWEEKQSEERKQGAQGQEGETSLFGLYSCHSDFNYRNHLYSLSFQSIDFFLCVINKFMFVYDA